MEPVTDGVDGLGDNAFGLMANLLAENLMDCLRGIAIRDGMMSTW